MAVYRRSLCCGVARRHANIRDLVATESINLSLTVPREHKFSWVVARSRCRLPDVAVPLSRTTTGAVCWVLAGPITIWFRAFLNPKEGLEFQDGMQLYDVDMLI